MARDPKLTDQEILDIWNRVKVLDDAIAPFRAEWDAADDDLRHALAVGTHDQILLAYDLRLERRYCDYPTVKPLIDERRHWLSLLPKPDKPLPRPRKTK